VPTPSRSARERRLAALERAAAQRERDVTEERGRAAWAALSRDEIDALAAECLIQHGADPATAPELWREGHRAGASRGKTWADLAAQAPEIMRLYLADLKRTARLGLSEMRRNPGPRHAALAAVAAPELADRLDDRAFRHLVFERARAVFGRDPHHFCQGFAWVLAKVASGAPAEDVTRIAYYGAERVAEEEAWQAECARRRAEKGRVE
jgi:hypothetical protein